MPNSSGSSSAASSSRAILCFPSLLDVLCALRIKRNIYFFSLPTPYAKNMRKFPLVHRPQPAARSSFPKTSYGLPPRLICISIGIAVYQSHHWKIPEAAKLRKNPIQSSPAALTAARAIYLEKCANCHGQTGKGDGPDAAMYYPSPASLADTKRMSSVTDGEIFYQISQGRRPMPAFKKRLTEEQRWQLVLFVRSLAVPESANH